MNKFLLVIILIICCFTSVLGRGIYEFVQGPDPYLNIRRDFIEGIWEKKKTGISVAANIVAGVLKFDTIPGYYYREYIRPQFKFSFDFNGEEYVTKDMILNYSPVTMANLDTAISLDDFLYQKEEEEEKILYRYQIKKFGGNGLLVASLADPDTYFIIVLMLYLIGPFMKRNGQKIRDITVRRYVSVQYKIETNRNKRKDFPANDPKAYKWIQKAAISGDCKAMVDMGDMYQNGQGVPQNYAKAIKWYNKAAKQGNSDAQSMLAKMYMFGQGIAQDYSMAFKWGTKAAEKGNVSAQYYLGKLYGSGCGIPINLIKSYSLMSLSAAQGYKVAKNELGSCQAKLTPDEISQAQEMASELWNKIGK